METDSSKKSDNNHKVYKNKARKNLKDYRKKIKDYMKSK